MTPAVRIYRDGKGVWLRHDVQLHYSRPQPLDVAMAKVRDGRTVFVVPEDAETVMAAVKEEGSGAETP